LPILLSHFISSQEKFFIPKPKLPVTIHNHVENIWLVTFLGPSEEEGPQQRFLKTKLTSNDEERVWKKQYGKLRLWLKFLTAQ
jgi:hypothetical protein